MQIPSAEWLRPSDQWFPDQAAQPAARYCLLSNATCVKHHPKPRYQQL